MSWLYSQALVAAYLADTCSDGAPFAPSSGSPTPQAYCAPDKMTAFSRPSRFGMTFAPLTEDHGAALLTWFQAGFPARTSAPPAKARASMASDPACGAKWRELSVRYDRDSHSWKTHRCLWDEDLPESSLTLPKWGLMRDGVLSERTTSALPTAETDAGLWPTPLATDGSKGGPSQRGGKGDLRLSSAVHRWPTPTANNYEQQDIGKMLERRERIKATKKNGNGFGLTLGNAVKLWPTPKANDAEKRGNFDVTNPRNGLPSAAKSWPTPVASMSKGSSPASLTRKSGADRSGDRLDHAVMASDGGQLNPTWVEWLMGWPLGWTDLKPLATAKCRNAPPQHGECCQHSVNP